jgi:mannose-6-phosphate isomerase-like protein (cupin superfamily)
MSRPASAAPTPDRGSVAQRWLSRGFSCAEWRDPPAQVWADFVHDTDEMVMLVDGELEVTFDGQTRIATIGEEILIPARARHTVRNPGRSNNRWYYGYRRL